MNGLKIIPGSSSIALAEKRAGAAGDAKTVMSLLPVESVRNARNTTASVAAPNGGTGRTATKEERAGSMSWRTPSSGLMSVVLSNYLAPVVSK